MDEKEVEKAFGNDFSPAPEKNDAAVEEVQWNRWADSTDNRLTGVEIKLSTLGKAVVGSLLLGGAAIFLTGATAKVVQGLVAQHKLLVEAFNRTGSRTGGMEYTGGDTTEPKVRYSAPEKVVDTSTAEPIDEEERERLARLLDEAARPPAEKPIPEM